MSQQRALGRSARATEVFDLRIPGRSFRTSLDRPERLLVAWHKQAQGVCELLDGNGNGIYGPPQELLWTVREYGRVELWETGARYA